MELGSLDSNVDRRSVWQLAKLCDRRVCGKVRKRWNRSGLALETAAVDQGFRFGKRYAGMETDGLDDIDSARAHRSAAPRLDGQLED